MTDTQPTTDRDAAAQHATPGATDPPERPQIPARWREWAHENLFSTWYNTLLTLVLGGGLAYGTYRALLFVFVTARWDIIHRNLVNLMVWLWPLRPSTVRPWIALFILVAVVGLLLGRAVRTIARQEATDRDEPMHLPGWRESTVVALKRLWPFVVLLAIIGWWSGSPVTWAMEALIVVDLLAFRELGAHLPDRYGRWTGLAAVAGVVAAFGSLVWFGGIGWGQWGGLMLTIFLAAGGIILSFPFGVALALGRRSSFPVVRVVSVAYIELIRGVPLITLLFMGSFVLGLFLPAAFEEPAGITRSLVAIVLFTAAYVAEIVRGGLQSVPQGQIEAAQAVGLSPTKQTRLIVLPQALRNVIPALVGQFISLLKDTSLVFIVGHFEILGVARRITAQGDFAGQGLLAETLFFASLIYWVFSYTMSRESQRLERRLGVGER